MNTSGHRPYAKNEELNSDKAVCDAAAKLDRAQKAHEPCGPIREEIEPLGVSGAYAVQNRLTMQAEQSARRVIGRKIGLTSLAVQQQLGVDQPDFGMLLDDMAYGDEEEIPIARLIQPKVEAEIAFVMARSLTTGRPTIADAIGAVAYALPAIEIVDSRIQNWDISIYDTIADNASAGLFVLGGSPKKLEGLDLRLCGMRLEHRGEPVSLGCGAACLGHPLNAVVWLARQMVELGRPLAEGDIVLSGALGPMVTVIPGGFYEARISGLGRVAANFTEA